MASDAWTGTFEADPDPTDLVSEGANRITETKRGARERGDAEHQWTDGVVGEANDSAARNNSGRHREGSARAFVASGVPPTTLSVPDANAQNVLDDGRMHFRKDDEYLLQVYDATAGDWQAVKVNKSEVLAADDVVAATASGERLQYLLDTEFGKTGGNGWVPVTTLIAQESDTDTTTSIPISSTTAWRAGANPSVTVPATGKYYLEVHAFGSFTWDVTATFEASAVQVDLVETAAALGTVRSQGVGIARNEFLPSGTRVFRDAFNMIYLNATPTPGATYTFRLDYIVGTGEPLFVFDNTTIIAKAIPY